MPTLSRLKVILCTRFGSCIARVASASPSSASSATASVLDGRGFFFAAPASGSLRVRNSEPAFSSAIDLAPAADGLTAATAARPREGRLRLRPLLSQHCDESPPQKQAGRQAGRQQQQQQQQPTRCAARLPACKLLWWSSVLEARAEEAGENRLCEERACWRLYACTAAHRKPPRRKNSGGACAAEIAAWSTRISESNCGKTVRRCTLGPAAVLGEAAATAPPSHPPNTPPPPPPPHSPPATRYHGARAGPSTLSPRAARSAPVWVLLRTIIVCACFASPLAWEVGRQEEQGILMHKNAQNAQKRKFMLLELAVRGCPGASNGVLTPVPRRSDGSHRRRSGPPLRTPQRKGLAVRGAAIFRAPPSRPPPPRCRPPWSPRRRRQRRRWRRRRRPPSSSSRHPWSRSRSPQRRSWPRPRSR